MDHVVYVDAKHKSRDLEELLDGTRNMIIRGAAGRELPYGRVNKEDILFLIRNNGEGLIRAKCGVKSVFNSEKISKDESIELVRNNQDKLNLTSKQLKKWAGKRYLVLIEIEQIKELAPFQIDRSDYGNMDDWFPVEKIENVKIN